MEHIAQIEHQRLSLQLLLVAYPPLLNRFSQNNQAINLVAPKRTDLKHCLLVIMSRSFLASSVAHRQLVTHCTNRQVYTCFTHRDVSESY